MSLQEEYAQKFAGLRHAYSVFTPNTETREDGKAKGKVVTISKTLTKEQFIELGKIIWKVKLVLVSSRLTKQTLVSGGPST